MILHTPTSLRTPPFSPPYYLTPNHSSTLVWLNDPNSLLFISAKPISRILSLNNNGVLSVSQVNCSKIKVNAEEEDTDHSTKLKRKIEALGVVVDSFAPGKYDLLYCPMCKGGQSIQRSLSFHISQKRSYAIWRCFHEHCGWAGQAFADTKIPYPPVSSHGQITISRPLTVESLRLEVLGNEVLAYFAERMISQEILIRNDVMQVAGDQKIIAFIYRREGMLVGCKYRKIDEKRFWQEKNTEKMLYGLADIAEADEIIIVEGELDKLSVEEAGYRNCVSVPSGAPQTVSLKDLPSLDKDTSFQYLWNCKDYLDKASRIILATDSDAPGQALAEELSRRLGKERCWHVRWPTKDEVSSFKDANEVLVSLGAHGLREAIDKAVPYGVENLN